MDNNILQNEHSKIEHKRRIFRGMCFRKALNRSQVIDLYNRFGAEHSNELSEEELDTLIEELGKMPDTLEGELCSWRRKVIAVTWKYLTQAGYTNITQDYVKECICTSQRAQSINSMTKKQLIKAFYLFNKKSNSNTTENVRTEE